MLPQLAPLRTATASPQAAISAGSAGSGKQEVTWTELQTLLSEGGMTDGLLPTIPHGILFAMNATVTMDVAGRLVLPKAVRERLHLRAGSKLNVEIIADKIELTPAADTDWALVPKGKRLVLAKTGVPYDAAAAVRADHEALAARGARR